jgi:hypothetical protein
MAIISDSNIVVDISYVISAVKGTYTDTFGKEYKTLEIFLTPGTVVKIQYVSEEERNRIFSKIIEKMTETQFKVK